MELFLNHLSRALLQENQKHGNTLSPDVCVYACQGQSVHTPAALRHKATHETTQWTQLHCPRSHYKIQDEHLLT